MTERIFNYELKVAVNGDFEEWIIEVPEGEGG